MTLASTCAEPTLPPPQGPLSALVFDLLSRDPSTAASVAPIADCDPYGIDLQLALYVCYELHYRGFAGVDPGWEWNPQLLTLRAHLEKAFIDDVSGDVGDITPDDSATADMDALSIEPLDGQGPSYYLRDVATWDQMREYLVHRSLYHLKEADPHAWAIPRLIGHAKAAFVAVEFDEYGAGHGEYVHQQLYADLMAAAGLDSSYLGYLDAVPGETLAVVNLMSYFGLHRSMRGAAIGHFAATEITSSPGSRRLVDALERMNAPRACIVFYHEHVEADAVHEQVVRFDVVANLLAREPHLSRDVVFGIRARDVVENRLADHIMARWRAGQASLRRPLR